MEIEGSLQISLCCEDKRVRDVEIKSTRFFAAVKIFHGKPVNELLQTLPLLYHVCGTAQASAAVTACEQAMAIQTNESISAAREMLVWMETAREHCWRILIDWPTMLGEEKQQSAIVKIQQGIVELQQALFNNGKAFQLDARLEINDELVQSIIQSLAQILQNHVFAMPVEQWLNYRKVDDLQAWLRRVDTVASKMLSLAASMNYQTDTVNQVTFLPELDASLLNQRFNQPDASAFVEQPEWQGEPCETTSLSRQQHHPLVAAMLDQHGNGVMTRMVARLVELASIPGVLQQLLTRALSATPRRNTILEQEQRVGLGQVEAARGRLVHRLELDNNIVQRYQILAPTEWNFHPQGIAAKLLKALPADDEVMLKQQAALLINTIDPCVRYEMTVH